MFTMSSFMNKQESLPDLVVSAIHSVVGMGPVGLHEPTFEGNEWLYVKECLDSTGAYPIAPK